jgi:class 3 adenylate cyclase/tetratricopeptide (TPR) repeat protein
MKCSRCQHENRLGAKFCEECAAPLERACANCGAELSPTAKFCSECAHPAGQAVPTTPQRFGAPESYTPKHLAEKILTSRSALEGERKQVTVLFADVSGFTALSERLDPEAVHDLMRRAFELMLAQVHRYEGTVNQFLGDGIMALFGAPIAHEDHAQRAVHAALGIRTALEAWADELRRQRGITFLPRQGLNTGLVVVGSIGSDLRMDYTAVGDTTNVAARLEQGADAGRIVISGTTHRLVEGYFYTRPLGGLVLKGKSEPVHAWEVIGPRFARTRLAVEAERGLTPFIGRERELVQLMDAFERARGGEGQIVFVAGEPGIGKSRLILEFRRRLGDQATWVEGHCRSFGRSIAFQPMVDLLKRTFRIEESDPEATIVRKIDSAVLRLGEDLCPTLPYLRYLLSVDPGDAAVGEMDAQQRRGEIFDAIRRLTTRAAEIHPQVCVFEDLHWMDGTTEDYLASVTDGVATSRILLILTYRPGYVHPFGERSYHTRIVIHALPQAQSVEMAGAMLGIGELPPDLAGLVVRKAEGNPFFVEEVVRSLLEIGAIRNAGKGWTLAKSLDEVVIPDTIQDVIMARIDRLEDACKRTLQLASVIGREFTRRLLDRIVDTPGRTEEILRELKAIELIYERSAFPELTYMFKHELTRDVAYNSLLVQRRKVLHRSIGLAIEELYADRLAEHHEMLAHHFGRAEEWEKALHYLRQAGAKAMARSASSQAVRTSSRHSWPGPSARVARGPSWPSTCASRCVAARPARRLRPGRPCPPGGRGAGPGSRRRAPAGVGGGLPDRNPVVDGGSRAGCRIGPTAITTAKRLADVPLEVAANMATAWAYHDVSDYPQAAPLLRRNIELLAGPLSLDRHGLPVLPSVSARTLLAWCHAWQGDFAGGLPASLRRRVSPRAWSTREPPRTSRPTVVSSVSSRATPRKPSRIWRAMSISRAMHARAPWIMCFLATASHLPVAWRGAPLFDQSFEEAEAIKILPCKSIWTVWWGEACLSAGMLGESTGLALRALSISRAQKERGYEAYALHLQGAIAARRDPAEAAMAEAAYREAMALATTLGLRPLLARCHLGLGRLYRSAGDRERARVELTEAAHMLRAMDMRTWREQAEAEQTALS